MPTRSVWIGIFVAVGLVLFGAGLFLLGNQHKAFRKHVDCYTEFANVQGIGKGAKVRVNGADAGQVQKIQIPSSPAKKFRLELQVDESLHNLVRTDSLVTVETEGVVGDKFLEIHAGTVQAREASPGTTLAGKEPVELGKLLEQAGGLLNQVGGTITQVNGTVQDVQQRLDGALNTVTATVNNANGIVTDVRHGKGTAGLLLEDPQTANNVRMAVANTKDATGQLKSASTQVNGILTDVQQRQLVAKTDQTIQNAQDATNQLNQTSQHLNGTLSKAFAEDQYGEDAGSNLRQTLSNTNVATGNLADDTEALKHEFFFKGFFKSRGYNNLNNLPVAQYRSGQILKKLGQDRQWLPADGLFQPGPSGVEELSAAGRVRIDDAVSQLHDLYSDPILVEGYAQQGTPAELLTESRHRATLVRAYLQVHYRVEPKNTGVIALSGTPPKSAGKATWDGVCLVRLEPKK